MLGLNSETLNVLSARQRQVCLWEFVELLRQRQRSEVGLPVSLFGFRILGVAERRAKAPSSQMWVVAGRRQRARWALSGCSGFLPVRRRGGQNSSSCSRPGLSAAIIRVLPSSLAHFPSPAALPVSTLEIWPHISNLLSLFRRRRPPPSAASQNATTLSRCSVGPDDFSTSQKRTRTFVFFLNVAGSSCE